MKKFAIIFAVVLSCFCVGVSASVNSTAEISKVTSSVRSGDLLRFSVVVSHYENGYATLLVDNLSYDRSRLEFMGFEPSQKDFLGSLSSSTSSEFALLASPTGDASANRVNGGECCVLVFKAKTDISDNSKVSARVTANGYTKGKADNWTAYAPLSVRVFSGGVVIFEDADSEGSLPDNTLYDGTVTPTDKATDAPLGDESVVWAVGIMGISALFLFIALTKNKKTS